MTAHMDIFPLSWLFYPLWREDELNPEPEFEPECLVMVPEVPGHSSSRAGRGLFFLQERIQGDLWESQGYQKALAVTVREVSR